MRSGSNQALSSDHLASHFFNASVIYVLRMILQHIVFIPGRTVTHPTCKTDLLSTFLSELHALVVINCWISRLQGWC